MNVFLSILTAVIVVSLVSFIGSILLFFHVKNQHKRLFFFVAFAAGALLSVSFLDLLPEALKYSTNTDTIFTIALIGVICFFILERFIFWHHHHTSDNEEHAFTYLNLIGDAVHNFIDGIIIAASFLVDTSLGLITTAAIIFHEIPQEIGDFGVLIHGGFTRARALLLNFLSALTAVLGAVVVLLLNMQVETVSHFLVPFTAGGFIYIAASDLIPEMKKEIKPASSIFQLIFLLIGLLIMYLLAGQH